MWRPEDLAHTSLETVQVKRGWHKAQNEMLAVKEKVT